MATRRIFAVLALLLLAGCTSDADIGTPTRTGRLGMIEDNGITGIIQDSKTGCEFVYAHGPGRALALIPGTCNNPKCGGN